MKCISLLTLIVAVSLVPFESARAQGDAMEQARKNAVAQKAKVEAARRSGGPPVVQSKRGINSNPGAAATSRVRAGASYNSDVSVQPRGGRPIITRTDRVRPSRTIVTPNPRAADVNVGVQRGGNRGGARRNRDGDNRGGNRNWTGNDNNSRIWQGGTVRGGRRNLDNRSSGETRVWTGRRGGHRGNWDRTRRHRSWWRSHYNRFALFGGGYYYWNSGYWYPAYGYDPYFNTYAYDAPIYGYNNLQPGEVVAAVQAELQRLGYDPGVVDGDYGPATRRALLDYQRDNDLPVTGEIDESTLAALGLE